jgi:ERCC4-type nuclease
MSSVGEEGLDIPAVDLVIFYEPVPSAIRQIQRIGRTGRQEKGEVIILIARGTRDVAYFWSTKNKQRKMYDVLGAVKKELALEASVGLFDNAKQLSLKEAAKETKKYTTANSDSNLNFPSQQSPAKIIPDESNSYLADSDVSDNKASINKRILDLNASIANDGSNDKTTMNVSDSKNKKLNEFNETEKVILKDLEKQVEIQKKLEAQKDANEVANTRTIVVDAREKANRIVKHFVDDGFLIDVKQLAVGDYILTDEIGIEFKTKQDFVDSIVDGRLMTQAAALARTFIKPLIVVQGEEDLYSIRNVHPNSIIGAMSTIAVSFKIPVLFTRNEQETYQLFLSLAKKQTQKLEHNPRTLKPKEAKEEQEFIVSGLPGIGIGLAKDLLKHFKSIGNILSADEEELAKVDGIGKTKAKKIKEMLKKEYEG